MPNPLPAWDPMPIKDTTVVVVLCVAAVQDDDEKARQIKSLLEEHARNFQALGTQELQHCSIVQYTKRTLTEDKKARVLDEIILSPLSATFAA